MKPYSVTLPDGTTAHVVEKTTGKKKSINLLLFKIRRPHTLIAYLVTTQESDKARTIYKTKRTGLWSMNGLFDLKHIAQTRQIKKAIDEYESKLGNQAYMELF